MTRVKQLVIARWKMCDMRRAVQREDKPHIYEDGPPTDTDVDAPTGLREALQQCVCARFRERRMPRIMVGPVPFRWIGQNYSGLYQNVGLYVRFKSLAALLAPAPEFSFCEQQLNPSDILFLCLVTGNDLVRSLSEATSGIKRGV